MLVAVYPVYIHRYKYKALVCVFACVDSVKPVQPVVLHCCPFRKFWFLEFSNLTTTSTAAHVITCPQQVCVCVCVTPWGKSSFCKAAIVHTGFT